MIRVQDRPDSASRFLPTPSSKKARIYAKTACSARGYCAERYRVDSMCRTMHAPARYLNLRQTRGDPGATRGSYLRVLVVLGLEGDINALSANDKLGRKLKDLALAPS